MPRYTAPTMIVLRSSHAPNPCRQPCVKILSSTNDFWNMAPTCERTCSELLGPRLNFDTDNSKQSSQIASFETLDWLAVLKDQRRCRKTQLKVSHRHLPPLSTEAAPRGVTQPSPQIYPSIRCDTYILVCRVEAAHHIYHITLQQVNPNVKTFVA